MAEAKQTKKHWYLMAFAVPSNGFTGYSSIIVSCETKKVTVPDIGAARTNNSIPPTACLLYMSYLGFMTKDEMNPPPAPPVVEMKPTEPYLDGLAKGINWHGGEQPRPNNPYLVKGAQDIGDDARQWYDGFGYGQRARELRKTE